MTELKGSPLLICFLGTYIYCELPRKLVILIYQRKKTPPYFFCQLSATGIVRDNEMAILTESLVYGSPFYKNITVKIALFNSQ